MCESEPHGASVSGGSPSVERINAPSPDAEEAPASPRDSLLTKDSEDGNQNVPEITEKEASGVLGGPDGDSNLRRDSIGTRESSLLAPGTLKDSLAEDSDEVEGIDPFSVKPNDMVDSRLSRQLSERRGSKTVNFKEPEVEDALTQNGSSPASSKGEEPVEKEGINEKHSNKQWSLGEGNPVYRLSMKLSPNLFNMTEIPGASQHREAEKVGYLTKLSGRSFPYIPQWKRRYCVLAKGRLYYYEREDSKTGEKANGVINLEYFDQVAEAAPKDCKKATNVFVITSQDRSFFDPGRHLFSAESLPDMNDWIKRLQAALEQIRNNNRPVTSTSTKESIKRRKEENLENKDKAQNKENQQGVTREKKKKKTEESHRPHKPGVSHETQTLTVEPTSVTSVKEAELQTMTSPKGGIQLPGLTSHKGIQLPGLSTKKELQDAEVTESPEVNKEELPMSGPTLLCVTKQRVKGPQGRRAPQNHRRTLAATALKKRASSLSALEYQDLNDNRSESSQGQQSSSRDSQTPDNEMEEVEESSQVRQVQFDDIDNDLFFKSRMREGGAGGENEEGEKVEIESKIGKRRSSTLKVNFDEREQRRSNSRSRNGTLLSNKLSRFRETMISMKRSRFESKEPIGSNHPDDIDNSRWNCSIL